MRRGVNCSWLGAEIPLSWEFFSVIKDELWLFLIPAGFAVIMLALFLEEVGFFLRHVPFALSWYHSITLLKFMGLITDFFGGKARMLEILAGEQVSPDPFPCCCCCCLPMIAINRTSLGWMMAAVLQLSVVRTILFFVTLVLWTDEQYDYGDVVSANPNMYMNVIIGVSTFLSFYGHLLFYKATKKALPGYGLRAKFVCIIVVLVLCGLQSGILETMGALEVVPCTPPFSVLMRSQLIYHYTVIVEMFCICLFARHTFRKVEPSLEEGFGQEERPPRGMLVEKAVQTEDVVPLRENPWPGWGGAGVSNPDCNSDSIEDSLCKVEHAPLDRFPFQTRRQETVRPENVTDESATLELPKLTVTADINVVESRNVTVV